MSEHSIGAGVNSQQDSTERRKAGEALQKALAYADDIIATLREPFLVLDGELRVRMANRSFYESFHVTKEETERHFLYDLGDGQWNIPGLRNLMTEVLSQNHFLNDFEVEHTFPVLGRKIMLLNARRVPSGAPHPALILLALEDVTERRQAEARMRDSDGG